MYEMIGTVLIGDGVAFLFAPRPHMLIWVDALHLPIWRGLVQWFADHRPAGQPAGVVEIALGAWILARAYRDLD